MNDELTTFIGVDLAWQSSKNHSCVAVARGGLDGIELIHYSIGIYSLKGVLDCIRDLSTANTVIAIDAPLIIKNQAGQRPCEYLIGRKFGARHASAHSTNLKRYPDADSVRLARDLVRDGFTHDVNPDTDRSKDGKWFFEVYPHPAQLVLFDLPTTIKYKKSRVADKKVGLSRLRHLIWEGLSTATPPLLQNDLLRELAHRNLEPVKGKSLKRYEDALDAVFCTYLGLFYWAWGSARNEMIGDLDSGYIINPTSAI